MDDEPAITIEREGDVVVLRLLGEHDIASAPALRAELAELVRDDETIVVDASETAFVDSTILHALLSADDALQRRDRRLVLQLTAGGRLERTLTLAGVVDVLPIAWTRADAMLLARTKRDELESWQHSS